MGTQTGTRDDSWKTEQKTWGIRTSVAAVSKDLVKAVATKSLMRINTRILPYLCMNTS